MDYRLLGPLSLRGDNGAGVLSAAKQRQLLALLLLHAGEVVSTDVFRQWLESGEMDAAAREDVRAALLVLQELGPRLGRPLADTLKGSRHSNMKELRVQSKGRPFRILFAFDSRRRAILLTGGNKQGRKRFYEELLRTADQLFDAHQKALTNAKKKSKR